MFLNILLNIALGAVIIAGDIKHLFPDYFSNASKNPKNVVPKIPADRCQ